MLKQRVLTALVMAPIALFGFFGLSGIPFALFVGAVVVVGAWEWARFSGLESMVSRCAFAGVVAAWLVALYSQPQWGQKIVLYGAVWWFFAAFLVVRYPSSVRYWGGQAGCFLIGMFVLVPAWQALLLLKQAEHGNYLILAVLLCVWTADIGAYFTGRKFGRRKLAPKVSPGKSWEGAIGGCLLCVVVASGVALYFDASVLQLIQVAALTVFVVAASIVGDLTESMFKRQVGLKDSSNLLPGHGGFLDRIDSLTAALPVFASILVLVGWAM